MAAAELSSSRTSNYFPLTLTENRLEVMDFGFGRSEDRISKLSDTVLCHILSFLPTKHAVGTTVLSTRWRYLWTTVPIFDFDGTDLFLENDELSEDREEEVNSRFEHFVNRVLFLSEAPSFRKFHLKGWLEDVHHVDTWISFAIKKNVQDLKLCNLDEVPIKLPHTIFTSKTLSVLTLTGVVLNVCHSVWLPSLKILNLDAVNYEKGDTMQILLSGCPVVEQLFLNMWNGSISNPQRVLEISVATLKRLMLVYLGDDFEGGFKLALETPKLECLTLVDHVSKEFFLGNLKSLSKASIMVGPTNLAHNVSGDGLHVYNLLNGISRVQFLDARFSFRIDIDDYLLPTFQNLTQLTFGGILNFKLLADLLHRSPILEVLILEVNPLGDKAIKSWDPPKQVPSCFLSFLKEIQIKELCGKGHELEMIEYFLQNANGLVKMTIGYYSPDNCFCKELLASRRKPETCQLSLDCLKHCGVVEPRGG